MEKKIPRKRVEVVSVKLVKEESFLYEPRRCSSVVDAYKLLAPFCRNKDREHLIVAGLNTKNEPTIVSTAHIGSINQSLANPREILKPLILSNSVGCLICHNHPSSDPTPSSNDVKFTKKMYECCKMLEIDLKDHLIIGWGNESSFLSLRSEGYFEHF